MKTQEKKIGFGPVFFVATLVFGLVAGWAISRPKSEARPKEPTTQVPLPKPEDVSLLPANSTPVNVPDEASFFEGYSMTLPRGWSIVPTQIPEMVLVEPRGTEKTGTGIFIHQPQASIDGARRLLTATELGHRVLRRGTESTHALSDRRIMLSWGDFAPPPIRIVPKEGAPVVIADNRQRRIYALVEFQGKILPILGYTTVSDDSTPISAELIFNLARSIRRPIKRG